MPVHRVALDEGDPDVPFLTSDLRKIVLASPAVMRALPCMMRALADEIERKSYTLPVSNPVPHLVTRLNKPHSSAGADSVAYRIALDLSMTLSRYLEPGFDPGTPGTPDRPRLQLKLLGTPEITLDGLRLKALERCSRASLILYILALHPRGLSGERLAAYIASDSAEVDAFDTDASMGLGAVRTFIWRLRKLAGWPGIIVTPGEQGGSQNRYRLSDETSCDLWQFEKNLDEAARLAVRATIQPDAADQAAVLRQDAILLYGGEFCKGIGSGSIAHAAQYLRYRYLQAVMLQATYWKERAIKLREGRQEGRVGKEGRDCPEGGTAGEPEPSVQEQNAWLEALSNYRLAAQVEPFDEASYAGAMLCQAHLGQSKSVRKTLAFCSRVLGEQLDKSPLPATLQTAGECLQMTSGVRRL